MKPKLQVKTRQQTRKELEAKKGPGCETYKMCLKKQKSEKALSKFNIMYDSGAELNALLYSKINWT